MHERAMVKQAGRRKEELLWMNHNGWVSVLWMVSCSLDELAENGWERMAMDRSVVYRSTDG